MADTDIVERLRGRPAPGDHCSKLIAEAADEIERWRVATEETKMTNELLMKEIERLEQRVADLEDQLMQALGERPNITRLKP